MVGRSKSQLEMGLARHCLAAVARQLKVNVKKNSNRYALQLETNGVQGKKGERDIECSHFIPDLLAAFCFYWSIFSFLARSKKQFAFLPPPLSWFFKQIQFSRRKASPIKQKLLICLFQNTTLLLIKSAVEKESGCPLAAAGIPCDRMGQALGFFPSRSVCQ